MDATFLNELAVTLAVAFTFSTLGGLAIKGLPRDERLVPTLSLFVHLATAPALLAIMNYVFVFNDARYYFEVGGGIARLMRLDLFRWGPEALKFTFQLDNDLSLYFPEFYGGMFSTSSMSGSVSFLLLLLNDAQYASFELMAGLAFLGKLAAYRGMRTMLPTMDHRTVGCAMFLVPSVVFWSSGIVKESWAITGLGVLTLWLSRVSKGSLLSSPHLLLIGLPPIALIKPYLLFPFTLAAGTWYALTREKSTHRTMRPLYVIIASSLVIGLMLALSNAFPAFSITELGASTAMMQRHGAATVGGSNYSLGNADSTTLAEQIAFAPLALTTVLVRPFIFEVRNFSMLLASLESTVLLVLLFQLFRKNSFGSVWATIRHSPPLAFCFVFCLVAGLAIGLATANFGTLSRYRIPMMPYYILLVLVLVDKREGVQARYPHGVSPPGEALGGLPAPPRRAPPSVAVTGTGEE